MPAPPRLEIFASTALGLESIAAGELKALAVRAKREAGGGKGKAEVGGVAFGGNLETLYRANLWLRTASRVLVRLGRFHASTFYELERRAKKLAWSDFLPETGEVVVRATCRKSRLYHSDAVAERVLSAIARVAPPGVQIQSSGVGEEGDDDVSDKPSQLFVVRIVDDQVEVSADSSGELLHRRGYRKEVAKAPLRETLAAAMVLASGWRKNEPLVDPLCGSGTIPVEAALIARNRAPGLGRRFQFMDWPGFDAKLWDHQLELARQGATSAATTIVGTDRDAGAIEAAIRNAERAGVVADIQFSVDSMSSSLSRLPILSGDGGWILSNPPYGVRVASQTDLRDLYSALGNTLAKSPGWRVGVLSADQTLAGQLRVRVRSRFDSRNGGIPVSFLASEPARRLVKQHLESK